MMGLALGLGVGGSAGMSRPGPAQIFGSSIVFDFLWSNSTRVGSLVTALADSGPSHLVASASGAARPTYNASGGGNAQGSVYFPASTRLNLVLGAAPTAPFTMLVVARSLVASGATQYLYDFSGNSAIVFQQVGGTAVQQYNGALGATGAIAVGSDFWVEALFNGASSGLGINGGALTVANAGATGVGTDFGLGNSNTLASAWLGNCYEWICVSGALSVSQRAAMKAYAAATFGTP